MVTILHTGGVDKFTSRFRTTESILIPIFADSVLHPCNNRLSLLYVQFLDNGDEYVIPYDHSEALSISIELDSTAHKFVANRKELRHVLPLSTLIDVNLLQYVDSGQSIVLKLEDTKAHALIKRNFQNHRNLNRIIPLSKHVEACRVLSSKMKQIVEDFRLNIDDPSFQFLNYNATDVFQQIEYSGIHVDTRVYKEFFGPMTTRHITKDSLTHTEYNLFTTTGRPSNRFGGVNFAALNKEDGSRSAFTSRFEDGMLVLIDYDAYHLRLIAELIGFKFPVGNVHEYLGRIYFKTDSLTPEQYDESKKISFQLLYGGITDEYKHIPFFEQVERFVDYLWGEFEQKGYIQSPIGQRKLYGVHMTHMHPQKLFNYFIQLHETERNIMTLERVLPLFHERQSKLVLYTYDSIIVDLHTADGVDFVTKVKDTLECEKIYPVKVFVGNSYHKLINVTDRFHS